MADGVPMAFCILTLHQVMKGTEAPPPMATRQEMKPIRRQPDRYRNTGQVT